jgi:hypothetical protein
MGKRVEKLVRVEIVPGRFVKMFPKDAAVVLKEKERTRDKMRQTSNVKREDVIRETGNVKRETSDVRTADYADGADSAEGKEFEYPVEEEMVVVRPKRRRRKELGIEN